MSGRPEPRRVAPRLAAFYATYFAVIGVNMAFWSLWLQESRGMAKAEIGQLLAVAAIASPLRFVDALRDAGYDVVDVMRFRDHHRYTRTDADAMARRAEACGATQVLTTAKDMVRLRPLAPWAIPMAWVPLEVTIEPADAFGSWLRARLAAVRGGA